MILREEKTMELISLKSPLRGEQTLKGIPKPLSFLNPKQRDKAHHDPQPSGHEMANHKENRSNNVLEPMCVQL